MNVTDPIADMLTRIRNASRARHAEVLVPASRLKTEMAQILVREGFVASFEESRTVPENFLKITLKYVDGKVELRSGLAGSTLEDFKAPIPMVGAAVGAGFLKDMVRDDARAAELADLFRAQGETVVELGRVVLLQRDLGDVPGTGGTGPGGGRVVGLGGGRRLVGFDVLAVGLVPSELHCISSIVTAGAEGTALGRVRQVAQGTEARRTQLQQELDALGRRLAIGAATSRCSPTTALKK